MEPVYFLTAERVSHVLVKHLMVIHTENEFEVTVDWVSRAAKLLVHVALDYEAH